ncbi:hypothetical protein QA601_12615 [Chitinispirillales bacterium ANBcel5]|uniref:hypothetical protein n=1 Tax=Cellulosispirillum alkaliphilum TaxID=3039283 RepID=UPI002A50F849|nr:hypothetical protein [Chitinispirillales bacterium ANBcel5]
MIKAALLALFCLSLNVLSGNELCEIVFEGCPEDFHGDTVDVPTSVVALSAGIRACDLLEVEEGMVRDTNPPAIMFVIDHSGSMMYHYWQYPDYPMDPMGTRYTVTRDLIDTLHRTIPDAEVGIAIFGEHLYLDSDNHPFVQQMGSPEFPTASYMPLLRLNESYGAGPHARLGYEILMELLETEVKDTSYIQGEIIYNDDGEAVDTILHYYEHEFVDLVYQPEFTMPKSTNINSGFDAAKEAFGNTDIPLDDRFVIFLSDGEANRPRGSEWEHVQGVDVPTTFTVFFTKDEQAPPSLIEMTENIRNSGYTRKNVLSDIWAVQTEYDLLMNLLKDQIMRPFLNVVSGIPQNLILNDSPYLSRTEYGEFLFASRYPLEPSKTRLNLEISYKLEHFKTGETKDTTYISTIYLNRTDDAEMPNGFSINCWDRSHMSVRYQGSRVNVVREYMDTLEVVFDPGTQEPSQVEVTVSNFKEQVDLEVFDLKEQDDGTWLVRFRREISETVPDDGILQHRFSDSLFVVYRNPDLPLDTIRLSLPFDLSRQIEIDRAAYYDNSADGFIDSIFVSVNHSLTDQEADSVASKLLLPSFRNFELDSVSSVGGGIALHVREMRGEKPKTSVRDADQIVVTGGVIPNGGLIQSAVIDVEDMIAPVILNARFLTDGTITDTLVISFSEQIHTPSDNQPFRLSTSQGEQYHLLLDPANTEDNVVFRFPVTDIVNVLDVSSNDSIWIDFSSDVIDIEGNYQRNPLNRRVLMQVKSKPYAVVVRVINNPFQPSKSKVPQFIRALDPELPAYGQVVVIEPEEPLRRQVTLGGKASIYDVVKNPVVSDVRLIPDNDNTRLYLVWDGRNSNGRVVGTGTYQAVLQISDDRELDERKNVRIGVRR